MRHDFTNKLHNAHEHFIICKCMLHNVEICTCVLLNLIHASTLSHVTNWRYMHTPHIIKFDMDFSLFIISNLITYIFPMIPIERLVSGSLRCSQDNLERIKLTTSRGLYSWAGQSRRPFSRGGGNQKMVKILTNSYGTSHTISNSFEFSRRTRVIENIHPEYGFCQHTDAQDASMYSPCITRINASTN
jgi:hypothetical protein